MKDDQGRLLGETAKIVEILKDFRKKPIPGPSAMNFTKGIARNLRTYVLTKKQNFDREFRAPWGFPDPHLNEICACGYVGAIIRAQRRADAQERWNRI